VLQTVTVGVNPDSPVFDGNNIWVPNEGSNSVTVVRASNGSILQTLTGNGLSGPAGAGFDGERVLVTNFSGNSLSLFKAADLSPLTNVSTGIGTKPPRVSATTGSSSGSP
jgi:DNA-binding beta-propeller fold protein YncE